MTPTALDSVDKLIDWWRLNGRSFLWRFDHDPYNIFIAETLLHRTRANNVLTVYGEFINRFPSFYAISQGSESELTEILRPLGLKWRVVLLRNASSQICHEYKGNLPVEKKRLMLLPGIGDYIASAIRIFAFKQREPLIDTNTVRVISRVKGNAFTDSTRRSLKIRLWYNELSENADPAEFAYSIIDLASLICKSNNPICIECPLLRGCSTGIQNVAKGTNRVR